MPCRLYRNHVIMTFPSFDTATSAWAPQANISWSVGPAREFEFVRFPNRLATEGEAMAFALRMGEEWIDRRLRRLRRGIGERRARVIDMIGAQSAERSAHKQRQFEAVTEMRRESFTFKQFKSAIAKSGLNVNEQLLQKSYAALAKLRSQQHLSWADARKKVEQSQEDLKAGGSPQTRSRAPRLPLTERDWRRIG
jgi:hypothetical protein